MAAKKHSSVRIGPIMLFALITVVSVAVLSVLALSTANASLRSSERQAAFTQQAYQCESTAQDFVSKIDEHIGMSASREAAMSLIKSDMVNILAELGRDHPDVSARASVDGNKVVASFDAPDGRHLDVTLDIKSDLSYDVAAWQLTTTMSDESDETLWTGTAEGNGE